MRRKDQPRGVHCNTCKEGSTEEGPAVADTNEEGPVSLQGEAWVQE
jgi:hypothetical protein